MDFDFSCEKMDCFLLELAALHAHAFTDSKTAVYSQKKRYFVKCLLHLTNVQIGIGMSEKITDPSIVAAENKNNAHVPFVLRGGKVRRRLQLAA